MKITVIFENNDYLQKMIFFNYFCQAFAKVLQLQKVLVSIYLVLIFEIIINTKLAKPNNPEQK